MLPHVFVVHALHGASAELHQFRASAEYRRCTQVVKDEFTADLDARYGT